MDDKAKYVRLYDLKNYMERLSEVGMKIFLHEVDAEYMYLRQMFYGASRPSPGLAQRICSATGGKITLHMLRPDIWVIE